MLDKLCRVNAVQVECFCVGALEIVEVSKRVLGEPRGCSINGVGALGVLKNLLKMAFHCRCHLQVPQMKLPYEVAY